MVLGCKECYFAFIASAITLYNVSFFASFLAVELKNVYEVSDQNMGFYFMILSAPYFFSCAIHPMLFHKVPRQLQFVICFAVSTICFALMGPSKLFGLHENLLSVCIGMGILGFIQSLCFVTALPEAMESI